MTESPTAITILVDNRPGEGLEAVHGFSALVERGGRRILYDTGQGGALAANAAKLGIDLASVDSLVLSHGHFDHTGGLAGFSPEGLPAQVYLHPGTLGPHFSIDRRGVRDIGMPEAARRVLEGLSKERLQFVHSPRYLAGPVGIGAPIERQIPFEDAGGPFFLDADGGSPDPVEEDLVLWTQTDRGLVVVVGCCHAGIVNTLLQLRRWTGEARIRAVLGGLHLLHASDRRLEQTVAALEEIAPEQFLLCHCTGERATALFDEAFQGRVTLGSSGMVVRF